MQAKPLPKGVIQLAHLHRRLAGFLEATEPKLRAYAKLAEFLQAVADPETPADEEPAVWARFLSGHDEIKQELCRGVRVPSELRLVMEYGDIRKEESPAIRNWLKTEDSLNGPLGARIFDFDFELTGIVLEMLVRGHRAACDVTRRLLDRLDDSILHSQEDGGDSGEQDADEHAKRLPSVHMDHETGEIIIDGEAIPRDSDEYPKALFVWILARKPSNFVPFGQMKSEYDLLAGVNQSRLKEDVEARWPAIGRHIIGKAGAGYMLCFETLK